uniref:FAS1 domain-containing protein n=2 Tax=Callorhinchus milii TaxID=7868 RepID=A0A4W3HNE2_CALMI
MSVFSQQLQRNLFRELSLEGPFTLFLPDTELTAQDNTVEEWERRGLVKDLLWYHLVGCRQLLHSKLIEQSSLIALSGHRIHITVRQNSVYLNGDSQIVRRDYVTANGIIHYISKVLVPHNLTLSEAGDSVPAPLKNLTTVAEENGYKRFSDLVKEVGLMPVIADPLHRPFTMFWPTDEALAALLPAQQHWLYSNQNLHHLLQVLNFHIISDWRIDAVDFPLKIEPRTMQGSTLSITCSRFEIVSGCGARTGPRCCTFSPGSCRNSSFCKPRGHWPFGHNFKPVKVSSSSGLWAVTSMFTVYSVKRFETSRRRDKALYQMPELLLL